MEEGGRLFWDVDPREGFVINAFVSIIGYLEFDMHSSPAKQRHGIINWRAAMPHTLLTMPENTWRKRGDHQLRAQETKGQLVDVSASVNSTPRWAGRVDQFDPKKRLKRKNHVRQWRGSRLLRRHFQLAMSIRLVV